MGVLSGIPTIGIENFDVRRWPRHKKRQGKIHQNLQKRWRRRGPRRRFGPNLGKRMSIFQSTSFIKTKPFLNRTNFGLGVQKYGHCHKPYLSLHEEGRNAVGLEWREIEDASFFLLLRLWSEKGKMDVFDVLKTSQDEVA